MKAAPYNMLLEAASKYNILALTTSCATSCIFCSHHQNPKEVEAFYINKLTKEQAENLIEFLDGSSKITIGESATRICEGEPFAFEHIMDLLEQIRLKYPMTPIQITTSGIYLNEEILGKLEALGNIELNISLNSSNIEGRRKLYGGREHMQAIKAVEMLRNFHIKFNGSIVAMPQIVGWEDLEQTVLYLADKGASTIRIFMPGYTKYTKIDLPEPDVMQKLMQMAERLRKRTNTPVIIEPSTIENLTAVIEGVVGGSPGAFAGIKAGDVVLKVDGKTIFSRVDAYNKLFAGENPVVDLLRQDSAISCRLQKQKNTTAGLVFNYDMAPETAARIKRTVEKYRGKSCMMLTSLLGFQIIKLLLSDYSELNIIAAKNSYFGGNIMCAGLLVLKDIEAALKMQEKLPEVLFLPQIMFDEKGRDLTGTHYMELEQEYNIVLEIV